MFVCLSVSSREKVGNGSAPPVLCGKTGGEQRAEPQLQSSIRTLLLASPPISLPRAKAQSHVSHTSLWNC